jgi:ABC-type branched-subunit amino acid transport system substrate-binding protein
LHEIAPQAVLYLGGTHHAEVTAALDQAGVSALRLTGIEIASAHPALGRAADLEGWIGLDTIDPANRVFAQFSAAFSARYKRDASHAYAAVGYDMGRLLAAVLAVVRPPSPEGVRAGLDTTRMVQSATGKAGTVISFARYDHRGFKGDPFVLVRVEDAGITPISQR